jgi:cytochrome b
MVWVLWSLVLLLGVSGWACRIDPFWGEEAPAAIHAWLATSLQACVCIHVGAVVVMSIVQRENLPRGMITGWKRYRAGR